MKRALLCCIWGLAVFGMYSLDVHAYEVVASYHNALHEHLKEQGFDDPLLPFLVASSTREVDQNVVINRYRLEQSQIVYSRHTINKALVPSITPDPVLDIPAAREKTPVLIPTEDYSEFSLKVMHWHLSTDNPEEKIQINKTINAMLTGLFEHSLFKETLPDIVVYTGVKLLQNLAQLNAFCETYLGEFYSNDYIARECQTTKDPARIYAVSSQHLLHHGTTLIISRYPLRGIESAITAPYRYCKLYGRWAKQHNFGYTLYFQVFLEKRWLKFATIASYDYFNLDDPYYLWEKEWKSCLADGVKRDLESWLAEDEVAVVITRIFNPKLNALSELLKNWMRLTHKEHAGDVVDFDPARNTLSDNLSWFYRYMLRKKQLTHFSLFKNSSRKRVKNFGPAFKTLAVVDGRLIDTDESSRTMLGSLFAVFYRASSVEKQDFAPFFPSLAEVKLPYSFVPESDKVIPLSKDLYRY